MRKEDREFKTIFFIWGYHLYVTIPIEVNQVLCLG